MRPKIKSRANGAPKSPVVTPFEVFPDSQHGIQKREFDPRDWPDRERKTFGLSSGQAVFLFRFPLIGGGGNGFCEPPAANQEESEWLTAGRNSEGENEMRTEIETEQKIEAEIGSVAASASYTREVTVNYRGPRRERLTIREAAGAAGFVRKILPDNSREHFAALYLNTAHEVIGFAIVSTGTANTTLVHPREVFQRAVLLGAMALIVAHNHPSGGERPSEEDSRVTKVLKEAGEVLGIRLLDHIIVTEETFWSFAEKGMF